MSDSDGRGVDGVRRCRAGRQRAESALDDSESALAAWCQAGPGGGAGAGGGGRVRAVRLRVPGAKKVRA